MIEFNFVKSRSRWRFKWVGADDKTVLNSTTDYDDKAEAAEAWDGVTEKIVAEAWPAERESYIEKIEGVVTSLHKARASMAKSERAVRGFQAQVMELGRALELAEQENKRIITESAKESAFMRLELGKLRRWPPRRGWNFLTGWTSKGKSTGGYDE